MVDRRQDEIDRARVAAVIGRLRNSRANGPMADDETLERTFHPDDVSHTSPPETPPGMATALDLRAVLNATFSDVRYRLIKTVAEGDLVASYTPMSAIHAGDTFGFPVNTSRQVGGSVALAAVTTIAATATSHYARSNAVPAFSGSALTHGFQVAFHTLAGVALAGAAIAAAFVESKGSVTPRAAPGEARVALTEAV